jgi:hypothetical protein
MLSNVAQPVAVTGAATQAISATRGFLVGYTIRETAGTAAAFRLWDNASTASGTILAVFDVPANGSVDVMYTHEVFCSNGVVLERVSGTTYEGSVRIG